jgi:hypothetical protein
MRSRHRPERLAGVIFAIAAGILGLALIVSDRPGRGAPPLRSEAARTQEPRAVDTVTAARVRDSRPVYGYSVIPGGVYDAHELRDAIAGDAALVRHYGSLRLAAVRAERLDTPRRRYVSYRVGDDIYWTKKPVTVAAREVILTDGNREIRARCGNELSAAPRLPVRDVEPSPEALDTETPAAAPTGPLASTPLAMAFPASGDPALGPALPGSDASPSWRVVPTVPGRVAPPPVPQNTDPDAPRTTTPDPSAETPGNESTPTQTIPEPALLVLVGAGGLGWLARARTRRKQSA